MLGLLETILILSAIFCVGAGIWRAWERSYTNEPRCRKCGYIAVALPEPRCPECGNYLSADRALTRRTPRWWLGILLLIPWTAAVLVVAVPPAQSPALRRLFYAPPPSSPICIELALHPDQSTPPTTLRITGTPAASSQSTPRETRPRVAEITLTLPECPESGDLRVRLSDLYCLPPDAAATDDPQWVPLNERAIADWLAFPRNRQACADIGDDPRPATFFEFIRDNAPSFAADWATHRIRTPSRAFHSVTDFSPALPPARSVAAYAYSIAFWLLWAVGALLLLRLTGRRNGVRVSP